MHVWGGFWEKLHYSAVFGEEKDGKHSQRSPEVSGGEKVRKDLRKIREERTVRYPGRPEGGPYVFFC
jgi:hypothetical protein